MPSTPPPPNTRRVELLLVVTAVLALWGCIQQWEVRNDAAGRLAEIKAIDDRHSVEREASEMRHRAAMDAAEARLKEVEKWWAVDRSNLHKKDTELEVRLKNLEKANE